jgi:hypothetical protein
MRFEEPSLGDWLDSVVAWPAKRTLTMPMLLGRAMNGYPTYQSIFAFDIAGSSARYRDNRAQLALRAAVYGAVRDSFTVSGISWDSCRFEDRGDGAIVVVPAKVSKVLLLDPLPQVLCSVLAEHNLGASADERIRLRVVVHAGEIMRDEYGLSGTDLVLACRLLDTDELRSALAHADIPLAMIVSDHVYEAIVRHRYRGIDPSTYHPISSKVKSGRVHGWVHLPGSSLPPVTDGSARPGRREITGAGAGHAGPASGLPNQ